MLRGGKFSMSKYVQQLITALNKECEIYKEYRDLAEEKQKIILSGEVKELEKILKQEQDIIVTMGKFDQLREMIIGNILLENKVKQVDNLTELAEYIPEPHKTELLNIRDEFSSLLDEVKNINTLNGKLIQQTLDYISFNINLLAGTGTGPNLYGNDADEQNYQPSRNIFDVKI